MKIAMLAPPWIEIPPPGYGGIEQVIALLAASAAERFDVAPVAEAYERAYEAVSARSRSPIR